MDISFKILFTCMTHLQWHLLTHFSLWHKQWCWFFLWKNYMPFFLSQEVQEDQLDTNSAYILFYERRNVDFSKFMPDTTGKEPDLTEIEDEFESDFKKMCVVQWRYTLLAPCVCVFMKLIVLSNISGETSSLDWGWHRYVLLPCCKCKITSWIWAADQAAKETRRLVKNQH